VIDHGRLSRRHDGPASGTARRQVIARRVGRHRAVAEKVMRQLPVVTFPGIRKVYVKRSDVAAYLEARTLIPPQTRMDTRTLYLLV